MTKKKMKKCTRCEEVKEATPEFFPRNKNYPDGLFYTCKACINKKSKEYVARYTAKLREGKPINDYDNSWRKIKRQEEKQASEMVASMENKKSKGVRHEKENQK